MVNSKDNRIAIFSIKPEFVELIKNGNKTIEFRKIPIKLNTEWIIIYATRPVKKVIGYASVRDIDIDNPTKLWRKYSTSGGISKKKFSDYFKNRSSASAINLGDVHILDTPIDIAELHPKLKPPQNFRYIDSDLWSVIIEKPSTTV